MSHRDSSIAARAAEPAGPTGRAERQALVLSMVGTAAFAGLGIALGVISGSQVILFDGFFSLLGVALSWMALGAARVVRADPTARYPFGRESFAPLAIGVEGVALLATCGYAALEALSTILAGGADIVGGWGIVYASLASFVPLAMAWWLTRNATTSELVAAEATQWRAGAAFGFGMLVAFVAGNVLVREGHARIAGYIDPGLVLVAAALFVVPPVRMLRTMTRELLEGAPGDDLGDPVRTAVAQVSRTHALGEHHLRMAKVGPKLYIEVDFVVDPDWRVRTSDEVRHALLAALDDLPAEPWLTVEFTADPTWGE